MKLGRITTIGLQAEFDELCDEMNRCMLKCGTTWNPFLWIKYHNELRDAMGKLACFSLAFKPLLREAFMSEDAIRTVVNGDDTSEPPR